MSPQGDFTASCTLKSWSWQTRLNHLVRWVTEQADVNHSVARCSRLHVECYTIFYYTMQPSGAWSDVISLQHWLACSYAHKMRMFVSADQTYWTGISLFAFHFFPMLFLFQDDKENLKENGLSSDDYTPSPSDEEYEHTLDCGPSAHTQSHKPEGQDHSILESKEESQEPHAAKTPSDAPLKTEEVAPTEETEQLLPKMPCPVPKPRLSRQTAPSLQPSPPTAKPRTIHIFNPSTPEKHPSPTLTEEIPKAEPDSRPKQSLRKLKLTDEEKTVLGNLQSFSADSDSETPGGSSSCSSSSATAVGPSPPKPEGLDGQEEEGYWSGSTASHIREKRNRRCFKRKELPSGQTRVRSKFSPWNLSSPRISRDTRLSVLVSQPGRAGMSSPL